MTQDTRSGNWPNNMTDAEWLAEVNADPIGGRTYATIEAYMARATKPLSTTAEIPAEALSERTRFAQPGQRCGNGRVRKISEAQLRYMRHLLNTRRYHKLMGERYLMNLAKTHNIKSHAELLAAVEFISLAGARTLKGAPRKATPAPTKEDIKSIAGIYELDGKIYRMKKARNGNHFYAELLLDAETGAFEYAAGMARRVPAQGRKLTLEEAEALSGIMGCCCCCDRTLTATVNGVGPAARFIGPVCEAKFF